jgi:AraC-like DNA-binding protein
LQYFGLRGPAYFSKCFSELYNLITQISTVHAYNHSLAGKYGLIHASVKYIEANFARQDLYTPMLAEMSGIGETYYRNIFLAVFNMPPARYIQLYRVEKAKELLLNTGASVEEIAVAVGFANASYFCKVFKSLTDMTPSEFAHKCGSLG